MFRFLLIAHGSAALLMVGGSVWAAVLASRLQTRPTVAKLHRDVRRCLQILLAQTVLLTLAAMAGIGFFFFDVTPLHAWFIVAMVELSLIYTGIDTFCVPRLFGLRNRIVPGLEQPSDEVRRVAADPLLVVPILAVPIGLAAVAYLMIEQPDLTQSLVVGLAPFAVTTLVYVGASRRAGRLRR